MRMLFMAAAPRVNNAGASGSDLRTIAALRDLGHEIDEVWDTDMARRIQHGNLHYFLELPFEYRKAMVRALSRKSYDVIRVNQPHGWRAARWLRNHAPARGRRPIFVHRSHGFEPHAEETLRRWNRVFHFEQKPLLRRAMNAAMWKLVSQNSRLIAKYADGHIVSASLDARFLIERYGVAEDRVAVLPTAPPRDYAETPAPAMTSDRLRRVLYVGQFAPFKAPMIVAEAMKRLAPDYECTWVCAPQHHPEVRALAGDAVRLPPWTTPEGLRDIFDAHGVFLFPSFFEGFGNVFFEAMSRGLCVVASDVGGAHDLISHGKNGFLVPPGNAIAVAEAVRTLNLASATAMSEAAAATARQWTWDRIAKEMVAFFEHLRTSVSPR